MAPAWGDSSRRRWKQGSRDPVVVRLAANPYRRGLEPGNRVRATPPLFQQPIDRDPTLRKHVEMARILDGAVRATVSHSDLSRRCRIRLGERSRRHERTGRADPERSQQKRRIAQAKGWVAERLNAPDLKSGDRASDPWVRIPPHPPNTPRHRPRQATRQAREWARVGWWMKTPARCPWVSLCERALQTLSVPVARRWTE